jgi:hypothetical protein
MAIIKITDDITAVSIFLDAVNATRNKETNLYIGSVDSSFRRRGNVIDAIPIIACDNTIIEKKIV